MLSLTFSDHFILVRATVASKPIPGKLGMRLDETLVHHKAPYNPSSGMLLGGGTKPENPEETQAYMLNMHRNSTQKVT